MTAEEDEAGEKGDCSSSLALSSRSMFALSEAGVESDWKIVQQCIKKSTTSLIQLDDDEESLPTSTGENSGPMKSSERNRTAT